MQNLRISIHALLAESDQAANGLANAPPEISIHALLAESDAHTAKNTSIAGHFYPRSPCGERQARSKRINRDIAFLSTLSLRRATNCTSIGRPKRLYFYPRSPCGERPGKGQSSGAGIGISIHALLAESDHAKKKSTRQVKHFYPRSPCGERLN